MACPNCFGMREAAFGRNVSSLFPRVVWGDLVRQLHGFYVGILDRDESIEIHQRLQLVVFPPRWPRVKAQIVLSVNMTIPTKIDKNGWCTYPTMVPLVSTHGQLCLCENVATPNKGFASPLASLHKDGANSTKNNPRKARVSLLPQDIPPETARGRVAFR